MATFVINEAKSSLTLGSSVFAEKVAAPSGQLLVSIYTGCNDSLPVVLTIEVGAITNNTIVITPAMIGQSSAFTQGVYRFVIKFTGASTVVSEGLDNHVLFFVERDIFCRLMNFYGDSEISCIRDCENKIDVWLYIYYDLLIKIHLCTVLCYDEACSMWNQLDDYTNKEVDCGC